MDLSDLLLMLLAHLALTGLPGIAATLLAARKGVDQVPVLLAIGLVASGVVGLLGFWAFYGNRVLGETFSYFVVFGSIALAAWSLYGKQLDRGLLKQLATPLVLWAFGSAFLLLLGFVHAGTATPLATAVSRFSHALPGDNYLPLFFAEFFFEHGHHGKPPDFASFLASDRPPLQIGYALSQRSFGWDASGLHYQVLAVALQQLWIIGLWALLVAARVGRVTRALTMLTVLVSSLAIVNGFFVWPKMLPAAMLLAAAALVMTPLWSQVRTSLWAAALIAALCAVALLGHGSSVFGVLALGAVALYRGAPNWRWLAVAAAVVIALMAPWSAYQKYGDPPGNRLAKWTLAGVTEIDGRGTTEAIVDSYREAGIDGTLHNKAENFVAIGGGTVATDMLDAALRSGSLEDVVRAVRAVSFYYLLPSMGILLASLLVMLVGHRAGRRNSDEWSFALACLATVAIGSVIWALLSFGNEAARTIIHVSSYLLPILLICGLVVGLRAVVPRFAVYFLGLNALLSLLIYAPSLDPPPGTSYSLLAATMAAVALICFGAAALLGLDRHGEPALAVGEAQAG